LFSSAKLRPSKRQSGGWSAVDTAKLVQADERQDAALLRGPHETAIKFRR
jgi:hypothetical protein